MRQLDGAAQQPLGLAVEIGRGQARRPVAAALLAPGRIAGLPFDERPPARAILVNLWYDIGHLFPCSAYPTPEYHPDCCEIIRRNCGDFSVAIHANTATQCRRKRVPPAIYYGDAVWPASDTWRSAMSGTYTSPQRSKPARANEYR